MALEAAGEAAVAADPAKGPLDDPALRQDDEAMLVAAADDLELPCPGSPHGGSHLRPLIACITDGAFDEREQAPRLPRQWLGPVAVLHIGRLHHDREQQAERVRQQVALAADDLLGRVVAGRVERGAPFCAASAVWLSMIAVVGLAARPATSRTAT